jgi:hypothetical protein
MKRSMTGAALVGVLAIFLSLSLSACVTHVVPAKGPRIHRGHGPPPHAPAHGYRHKHPGGVELWFDGAIGVYVVVGAADHYFHDGRFYRWSDVVWLVSTHPRGPWGRTADASVPRGLWGMKKAKKHHRGHGPAKRR